MIRVYVNDSFPGDHLDVAILNVDPEVPGDRWLLNYRQEGAGDDVASWPEWRKIEDRLVPVKPTFRIPREAAEGLVRALTTHFQGGVDDLAALRNDYNAERGRVDKLIDVVSDIARRGVEDKAHG